MDQPVGQFRLTVGITGATGAIYGVRMLEVLRDTPVETHLIMSEWARKTIIAEVGRRPEEVLALAGGFGSPNFWSLLWWAVTIDVATDLDEIGCPVLLTQGSADLVAAGQTPRFLPQIPGARFRVLPWAGHAGQGDAPAQVASLVRETAARAAASAG